MKLAGGAFLLIASAAAAQWPGDQKIPPVTYPTLPRHGSAIASFVPRGWKLNDKAVGDLNGDSIPDAALAIWMNDRRNSIHPSFDPKTRYDTNPMMLVVLFGDRNGGYDLASANHALIPRRVNPNQDPPFNGVSIANGSLRVKMHEFLDAGGWRMGTNSFAFRWQDGAFRLIGYDRDAIIKNTGATEVVSVNYPARRMVVKTGTMAADEGDQTKTVTLPKKPLLTLDQVGNGLMFEPDGQ
jgi:hypothetical protein